MPTKIIVEYAKSDRSSCKGCGKAITAQALRLGIITIDARGFDVTKWHHLDCFPEKIDSPVAVKGFELLKGVDHEALNKLVEVSDKWPKKGRYLELMVAMNENRISGNLQNEMEFKK